MEGVRPGTDRSVFGSGDCPFRTPGRRWPNRWNEDIVTAVLTAQSRSLAPFRALYRPTTLRRLCFQAGVNESLRSSL